MKTWSERPTELAYLYNPGYCGWLLREAVDGYALEKPAGMPFAVAFLVLPVVLHQPTRDLLPRGVATVLQSWLQKHPDSRVHVAERTRDLSPFTREALLFLGTRGYMVFADDGSLTTAGKLKPGKGALIEASSDLTVSLQKAKFVGRWFALAGSAASVFQAWGVCP